MCIRDSNIPGVPGVGEKTALDLVRRFGKVEDIYAGLDGLDTVSYTHLRSAATS